MFEPRTITVEIDPERGTGVPSDNVEAEVRAAVDTAWKLLRESAVRATMIALREEMAEQGIVVPTDEELFSQSSSTGGPASYLELAPDNPQALFHLNAAVRILVTQAAVDAEAGLGFGQGGAEG